MRNSTRRILENWRKLKVRTNTICNQTNLWTAILFFLAVGTLQSILFAPSEFAIRRLVEISPKLIIFQHRWLLYGTSLVLGLLWTFMWTGFAHLAARLMGSSVRYRQLLIPVCLILAPLNFLSATTHTMTWMLWLLVIVKAVVVLAILQYVYVLSPGKTIAAAVVGWVAPTVIAFAVGMFGIVGFALSPRIMERFLKPPPFEKIDKPADLNWSVQTSDGHVHTMSEWRGKTILLNVWATWCAPCRAEFPSLARLNEKVKDNSIVIVAVSEEPAETVAHFAKKQSFPFIFASVQGHLPSMFTGNAVPLSFVIGPSGQVIAKHEGSARWDSDETVGFLRAVASGRTDFPNLTQNYETKSSSAHLEEDHRLAEEGNLRSQQHLGQAYFEGNGLTKNHVKSLYYYKMAAEQGDGRSASWVGYLYLNGEGIKHDPAAAVYWYERAALRGESQAAYSLGFMYQNGQQIPRDTTKAITWFQKAAKAGNPDAQYALGYCLFNQGVPESVWMPWFELAAKNDNAFAQIFLGGRCLNRNLQEANQWFEKAIVKEKPWGTYSRGLLRLATGGDENIRQAFSDFKAAAEMKIPDAQYTAGQFYLQGLGIPQDTSKAISWMETASSNQSAYAMGMLSAMYRGGVDVDEDDHKASEWLEKIRRLALDKNADAQLTLGLAYQSGGNGRADVKEASEWYRQSALQGNPVAALMLGSLYDWGVGVPQNSQEAEKWLTRAVNQGSVSAQFMLASHWYRQKGFITQWRAKRLFKSVEQAAQSGSMEGAYCMGYRYEQGWSLELDQSKALYWYLQAAERGNAQAQYALGNLYQEGSHPNDSEAVRWYAKAIHQLDPGSIARLGTAYLEGKGISRDPVRAKFLLSKVRLMAGWGNAVAQYHLGEIYERGIGIPPNEVIAAQWFKAAAEQGMVEGQYKLGIYYREGRGGIKDQAKALEWLQRAADQGYRKAIEIVH